MSGAPRFDVQSHGRGGRWQLPSSLGLDGRGRPSLRNLGRARAPVDPRKERDEWGTSLWRPKPRSLWLLATAELRSAWTAEGGRPYATLDGGGRPSIHAKNAMSGPPRFDVPSHGRCGRWQLPSSLGLDGRGRPSLRYLGRARAPVDPRKERDEWGTSLWRPKPRLLWLLATAELRSAWTGEGGRPYATLDERGRPSLRNLGRASPSIHMRTT